MVLFEKKNKKEQRSSKCCCCNCDTNIMNTESPKAKRIDVKILGGGCGKCNQLEAATKAALEQLGMDTTVEHITDYLQIAAYGVMITPALLIDDKVVSYGKVLKTDDVIKIIKQCLK
ncbi:MAG: thioredoxin family protein [Bacilli bacterium]|nr:thioredoxin family protein [Bacilli bacterium]MDD4388213.1 thioredoxin family protein [Bacilli bacterium]